MIDLKKVDDGTCAASREERSPPPIVILSIELKITKENCNLRTCEHEQKPDQQQETEHVVVLIEPQRRENEIKFHIHSRKWQQTTHNHDLYAHVQQDLHTK